MNDLFFIEVSVLKVLHKYRNSAKRKFGSINIGSDIVIITRFAGFCIKMCIIARIMGIFNNGSMPIVIDLEYIPIENDIETDVIYETSTEYPIPYAFI